MMETVCYPAMEEVAQERLRGAAVELKSLPPEEGENLGHLDLLVHMGDEQVLYLQDLAAAVLGAGLYLSGARSGNHLLPAGDLPAEAVRVTT